ncbi:MAG: hypothetical protein KGO83_00835 [Paenibacillaceae bacterium]|jgi:hypothetical protein|nr:hypothetical protein [Paenibacillaceae bacterium]
MIPTPLHRASQTDGTRIAVCAQRSPQVRITIQAMHPRNFSRRVSSASDARSMYRTIHHGSSCVPGTFLNRALG